MADVLQHRARESSSSLDGGNSVGVVDTAEVRTQKHLPVSIAHALNKPEPVYTQKKRIMDGFMLLQNSGAQLPDDARQATLIDKHLYGVLEEDMTFFPGLVTLDVSENFLDLEMFRCLPAIKELRLACNNMNDVGNINGHFNKLVYLDLSYNNLSTRAVQHLDELYNLRELDLSGNDLKGLPREMYRFRSLEKLYLDNNKIDDTNVFIIMAAVSHLRYLSLAYNFLSNIPQSCIEDSGMYPLLQCLDLSFNYFGSEDDVQVVLDMSRLEKCMLYGNPLLGPSGEDPQYMYVEDLYDAANEGRLNQRMCKIDLITEIPRKRNLKKGQPPGRHGTYRDFSVVSVGGDFESEEDRKGTKSKTSADWREEGNKTLFAEAIAQAQAEKLMSQISNPTFITATGQDEEQEKVLKLADDVMDQVAGELDLTTSAEILYFQDRVRLGDESGNRQTKNQQQQQQEVQYNEFGEEISVPQPADKIPHGLFSKGRTMADPQTLQTHPIAVKTAIRALQFAINNPLTNYDEVPGKGGLPPKDYVKHTHASTARRLPRVPESAKKHQSEMSKVKNKSKRGLGDPVVVVEARRKERDSTLKQIEAVLDDLNENADKMAMKGTGNAANMKDNVDVMKGFARPKTGLKNLVKLVDEVVKDLDS
jgi:hypothetical protein